MELNWSTFILEIINFLILVWLLKHFFYKPVLNIIARRKQAIQDELDKAEAVHTDAESLKSRYENRLEDWEKEKADVRHNLLKEIEVERKRAMDNLAQSIQQEKEKVQVLLQREKENELQKIERVAIQQSLAVISRLLSRLASPGLESTIIQLVLEDLDSLPAEQQDVLQKTYSGSEGPVYISSAYPLDEKNRNIIKKALSKVLKQPVKPEFSEDPSLLAGLHIDIGPWNLQASLRDELKYFSEMDREL